MKGNIMTKRLSNIPWEKTSGIEWSKIPHHLTITLWMRIAGKNGYDKINATRFFRKGDKFIIEYKHISGTIMEKECKPTEVIEITRVTESFSNFKKEDLYIAGGNKHKDIDQSCVIKTLDEIQFVPTFLELNTD